MLLTHFQQNLMKINTGTFKNNSNPLKPYEITLFPQVRQLIITKLTQVPLETPQIPSNHMK